MSLPGIIAVNRDRAAISIPTEEQTTHFVTLDRQSAEINDSHEFALSASAAKINKHSTFSNKEKTSPIEGGMAIGFITASCLTIIGIPVIAVTLAEAEGKISAKNARRINELLIPFTFPGLLVGLVGGMIGAGVGGCVALCKKIAHRIKKHHQHA